jgi:tetratricopeptide (TPR) repeat protein
MENTGKTPPSSETSSALEVGGKKYTVVTRNTGGDNVEIVTTVHLGGKAIRTEKNFMGRVAEGRALEKKILEFMQRQHRTTINRFRAEKLKDEKSPSYYLKEVKNLLGRKSHRKALALLGEAIEQHPDDPFILSYYGSLIAIVEGRLDDGIKACRDALLRLKKQIPYGLELFYPSIYLNLGRAYLAAGMKKEAVETFKEGVEKGGMDEELMKELRALGLRRKPPVPLLKRSHPINIYIGRLLHKMKK